MQFYRSRQICKDDVNPFCHAFAIVLFCAAFQIGCGRSATPTGKNGPIVVPSKPADAFVQPVRAAFDDLDVEPNQASDVQWPIALTLAEIASTAYDSPDSITHKLQTLGAKEVFCFSQGSSAGVVASDDNSVVIAFRGTQSIADILTDIKVFGTKVDGGTVHQGFWAAVESVYDLATTGAEKHGAKSKKVWITGHSLGGAMAVAFTFKAMKEHKFRPAGIITFGQPLVMSDSLCQFLLDEFKSDYVRFVNHGDPIARVLKPYKHSGARVFFKNSGYELRKPTIAYSAPSPEPTGNKNQLAFTTEPESELQMLTDEELNQLEKDVEAFQITKERLPKPAKTVTAVGSLDPFAQHYMPIYIKNIKTSSQAKSQ